MNGHLAGHRPNRKIQIDKPGITKTPCIDLQTFKASTKKQKHSHAQPATGSNSPTHTHTWQQPHTALFRPYVGLSSPGLCAMNDCTVTSLFKPFFLCA